MSEHGPFATHDQAAVKNCSDAFLNSWHIYRMEERKDTLLLYLVYSTDTLFSHKQLGVVETEDHKLVAQFAPRYVDVRFSWLMVKPDRDPLSEFMLVHAISQNCARVAEDGFHIEVTTNCSWNDPMAKWTLFWPEGKVHRDFDDDYSNTYFLMAAVVFTAVAAYLIIWLMKRYVFIRSGKQLKYEKKRRMPVIESAKRKNVTMTSKFRKKAKM